MGQRILGVIAGVIMGMFFIYVIEAIGHSIFPIPEGIDFNDPKAVEAYISDAPTGALLFVILAYIIGSFLAGLFTRIISKRQGKYLPLVSGTILMAAGIMNVVMIPHPLWMTILAIVVFLPSAWLGGKVAR
jgi:hypothetical protein